MKLTLPAILSFLGGAMLTVAASTWGAHEYLTRTFATVDKVLLVGIKADIALDARIASLRKEYDELKRKPNKNAEDLQDLDYYRKQIDYLKKLQRGEIAK